MNDRWVRPAQSAWEAGDASEAERLFKASLRETHNDCWVALHYAEMLEKLGRLREAQGCRVASGGAAK